MLQGRNLSDSRLQLDSLDGLRGTAVLLVVFSHASHSNIDIIPLLDMQGVGKMGVFLFFLLSSFLLTSPFISKGEKALNGAFLLNYFVRRFFRVYPLYLLYLLMAVVSTALIWRVIALKVPLGIPFELSLSEFVDHVFLQNGKGVTWSILVEFKYYFMLPILALTYSIVLKNRVIPCLALTVVLVLISQVFWPQSEAMKNDSRLGPYLPIFFIGSFMAVVQYSLDSNTLKVVGRVRAVIEFVGLLAMTGLILTVPIVLTYITGQTIPYDFYHKQYVVYALLWAVVIFAAINGAGFIRYVYESRVLRYIGFISFSVYLLHVIALGAINRCCAFWFEGGAGLAAVVITLLISHMTWLVVERPSSKITLASIMNFKWVRKWATCMKSGR